MSNGLTTGDFPIRATYRTIPTRGIYIDDLDLLAELRGQGEFKEWTLPYPAPAVEGYVYCGYMVSANGTAPIYLQTENVLVVTNLLIPSISE